MFRVLTFGLWIFLFGFLIVNPVLAACNLGTTPNLGCLPAGLTEVEDVFKRFISVAVGLAFIALVIMLIMAGIKFLTSGGEGKAVQSASNTVTWAILGILFLAIAWLILLLIEALTGIKVTFFDIKQLCDISVPRFCP